MRSNTSRLKTKKWKIQQTICDAIDISCSILQAIIVSILQKMSQLFSFTRSFPSLVRVCQNLTTKLVKDREHAGAMAAIGRREREKRDDFYWAFINFYHFYSNLFLLFRSLVTHPNSLSLSSTSHILCYVCSYLSPPSWKDSSICRLCGGLWLLLLSVQGRAWGEGQGEVQGPGDDSWLQQLPTLSVCEWVCHWICQDWVQACLEE